MKDWAKLYRKYIHVIYHCPLFSQDTKARIICQTRHAFRYGVPMESDDGGSNSTAPTRPYAIEIALTSRK